MNKRCVVAHAGARDDYQLALGLSEKQYLETLVTDFYSPNLLAKYFSFFKKRHKDGLNRNRTFSDFRALIHSINFHSEHFSCDNEAKDLILSTRAYNVAKKTQSNLFCYSYYASGAFRLAQTNAPEMLRFLFQLHPHPLAVRNILEEELMLKPEAKNSIIYENEFSYSEFNFKNLSEESLLAHRTVVASSYTKNTLIQHGVNEKLITVIPYGIDKSKFPVRKSRPQTQKFRIIYVGSLVQRKGISYLLEAINLLKTKNLELILCSRGYADWNLINSFSLNNVLIKRDLNDHDLSLELQNCDIFVLPSLSEGFAHVILQAMASGLPVITTPNTCGPDVIDEGKQGFIVPIRDAKALADKIDDCISRRNDLFDMGMMASRKSDMFSWNAFRDGIVQFYESNINLEKLSY